VQYSRKFEGESFKYHKGRDMHNHTMLSQERLEQQSEEIKKMREATAELNLYESLQKHFL